MHQMNTYSAVDSGVFQDDGFYAIHGLEIERSIRQDPKRINKNTGSCFDDLVTRQEDENGREQGDKVFHFIETVRKVFGSSLGYLYSGEYRYGRNHIGSGMNRIRKEGH